MHLCCQPADARAERRPAEDVRREVLPGGNAQGGHAEGPDIEQRGVAAPVRQVLALRHHDITCRRRKRDRRVPGREGTLAVGIARRRRRVRRVQHGSFAAHQYLHPVGGSERPGERVGEYRDVPAALRRSRAVERRDPGEPDGADEECRAHGARRSRERVEGGAVDTRERPRIARGTGRSDLRELRSVGDERGDCGRGDRHRVSPAQAVRRLPGRRRAGNNEEDDCSGQSTHVGLHSKRAAYKLRGRGDPRPMSHLSWPCGFSPSPLRLGLNFPVHRPGGPVSTETLQNIALFEKCRSFLPKAREVEASGLHAWYKPISRSEDTVVVIEGKERIMMGSNNYLGLTHHPEVLGAAKAALDRYGSGCTGSRLLNGTLDLHQQLEAELAQFFGKEACIVFSTGYQANLGVVSGLVGRGDFVFLDKLDHASIVDGAKMSYGETMRFNHGDLAGLERKLQRVPAGTGLMIIVDGVYSMEGDIADVPGLLKIAQKYGAALVLDDAHAAGVLGPRGDGTAAHFGLTDDVDLIVGTFSKSLASIGGFAAAAERVIHFLKHNSRPMIFTAALPPANTAGVLAALHLLQREPERRERLWENTRRLQEGLRSLGYDIGPSETPIVPVVIGPLEKTFLFWRKLFEAGVFTNPVVPPAVPPAHCRLRTSLMATHTTQPIEHALEVFARR